MGGRFLIAFLVLAATAGGQNSSPVLTGTPLIRTFAGTEWTFPSRPVPALDAPLGRPYQMGFDAARNLYVVDPENALVLKSDASGNVAPVAGNGFVRFSGDGGGATETSLNLPYRLAVAPDGTFYVSEYFTPRIRRVRPSGIIDTYAGNGQNGFAGDGGPATAASFGLLDGELTLDAAGNLYVADHTNRRVRRISADGTITTVAGNGQAGSGGDGGPATQASLMRPVGVAVDAAGNLYISDPDAGRVRRVDPRGIITTIAGIGGSGFSGDGGPATAARLSAPVSVDFDAEGRILILDGLRVRRIAGDGTITTIAGRGGLSTAGDGGPALQADFGFPVDIAVAPDGALLITDTDHGTIRRVDASGIIRRFAGNRGFRFTPNGIRAEVAVFNDPVRAVAARNGTTLITDGDGQRIYRVGLDGSVGTVAGNGVPFDPGSIRGPTGIIEDAAGNIYFCEGINRRILRIAPNGAITPFAGGGGNDPGDGGPAAQAALREPRDLAFDSAGNLYVTELDHARVRRITPAGLITTVAGTGVAGFGGDGGPATQAQLRGPHGIAIDQAGNIFVADAFNHRIRRIAPDGRISTYAGNGQAGFGGDGGPALNAMLLEPNGLAVDGAGNLFIADTFNHRVRVVTTDGVIRTLAGTGQQGFSGDGGPASAARLDRPTGLSVDALGSVLVVDRGSSRVRIIAPAVVTTPSSPPVLLSFSGRSGDGEGPPQNVPLTNLGTGLPLTLNITTESGGSWLRGVTTSPVFPASVDVFADASRLAPGTYRGTIRIQVAVPNLPAPTINVTFTVAAAVSPVLSADAAGLSFALVRGSAAQQKRLLISNAGGGSAPFTVTASTVTGGSWLSVSPSSGSATPGAPVAVTVTANPAGLAAGTYTGRVRIAGTTEIEIPATLAVSASGQSIRLTQTGLSFVAAQGGSASGPLTLGVLNVGQGSFRFTARASTLAGGSWLSVSPGEGSSDADQPPAAVTASVNPAGLAPGDYYGQIEIGSPTADNSPQFASVVLTVVPAAANPGPFLQPLGLVFTGVAGGTDPASQSVLVSNLTVSPLSFGSAPATLDGGSWLRYQPSASSLPGGTTRLVVQPEFANLAAGVYRGAVTLVFSDGSIRTIAVLLVLAPNPGRTAAAGCTPTRLLPLVTSLGANFRVPASLPTPVEVTVVDDCGDPVTSGAVSVSFSNTDPPVPLTSLRNGRWSGTWVNRDTSLRDVVLTVTAESGAALRGTAQLTGGLGGDSRPPVIAPGAIVSAASLNAQAPLAPGSLISLFGSRLGEGVAQAQSLPLDTLLAGTTVTVAGRRLPLLYSSDGQVNALLPQGIPVNTRFQMIVRRGNQLSTPEEIVVAAAQPAVFTRDATGRGAGHIYVAGEGGSLRIAAPESPARAGDVLVVYCAGLGEVDQTVADGVPAPASPLARTREAVTVTVGGRSAPVSFAGLAPGFTGLYQVNVTVPAGVAAGDDVPFVVSVAGQSSPAVTMAVR